MINFVFFIKYYLCDKKRADEAVGTYITHGRYDKLCLSILFGKVENKKSLGNLVVGGNVAEY
jgi:hypothetical protein